MEGAVGRRRAATRTPASRGVGWSRAASSHAADRTSWLRTTIDWRSAQTPSAGPCRRARGAHRDRPGSRADRDPEALRRGPRAGAAAVRRAGPAGRAARAPETRQPPDPDGSGGWFAHNWLRGLDLNQRPLGYEGNGGRDERPSSHNWPHTKSGVAVRPAWSGLGRIGRRSRTRHGQFTVVACETHQQLQGVDAAPHSPNTRFRGRPAQASRGDASRRKRSRSGGAGPWYSLDVNRPGLDAYKIVLYRQDDGSWVAEVPAISGCYALMATREEALAELESRLQHDRRGVSGAGRPAARGHDRNRECLAPPRGSSSGWPVRSAS